MNNLLIIAAKAVLPFALILAATNLLQAQTTKEGGNAIAPASNTQTVNAQQSGPWTVGIDQAKNAVQVSNSESNPIPVKVTSGPARKPFQFRVIVQPTGTGNASAYVPIPAGKRLVIENVSAIGRTPAGLKMEINFFTYFDSNGDGQGDLNDITFHRIALVDQGTFDDLSIASANHKVLIFADEQIGTAHYGLSLQARLSASTTAFAQAQVTFSGYVEDLPTTP